MTVPYTLTSTSLTIMIDWVPYAVPKSHPHWNDILAALDNGADEDTIRDLLDIVSGLQSYMEGAITVTDRVVYFRGEEIDTSATRRILEFRRSGQHGLAQPLIKFLDRVMQNPSRRSVQGLFDWLETSTLPIASDGKFLAWKIVNDDYTDCYTGKFDNSIGKVVEIPRNAVDEDPDQTCSYGLHFCSTGYLPNYGPSNKRVVVVKIDPADVVAFPKDYQTAKGRACRYEVVAEVPADTAAGYFPEDTYVYDVWDDEDEDYDYDAVAGIEVGQKWESRAGGTAIITGVYSHWVDGIYTLNGEDFESSWNRDGTSLTQRGKDLVELLSEPKPAPTSWFEQMFG